MSDTIEQQIVRVEGKAEPHHVLPQSGWISYYIGSTSDVAPVVALFRLNYDRLWIAAHS